MPETSQPGLVTALQEETTESAAVTYVAIGVALSHVHESDMVFLADLESITATMQSKLLGNYFVLNCDGNQIMFSQQDAQQILVNHFYSSEANNVTSLGESSENFDIMNNGTEMVNENNKSITECMEVSDDPTALTAKLQSINSKTEDSTP